MTMSAYSSSESELSAQLRIIRALSRMLSRDPTGTFVSITTAGLGWERRMSA